MLTLLDYKHIANYCHKTARELQSEYLFLLENLNCNKIDFKEYKFSQQIQSFVEMLSITITQIEIFQKFYPNVIPTDIQKKLEPKFLKQNLDAIKKHKNKLKALLPESTINKYYLYKAHQLTQKEENEDQPNA